MEFKITRTSLWLEDEKPCEEAYKKELNSGVIWCVKINSLEELLEFQDKYDEIILSTGFRKKRVIEIYDDYRE